MDSSEKYRGPKSTSDRPTMRMCRFISGEYGPCYGPITWCLEKLDAGSAVFYACDAHLAAGIWHSGFPVRIEKPEHKDGKKHPAVSRCKSLVPMREPGNTEEP